MFFLFSLYNSIHLIKSFYLFNLLLNFMFIVLIFYKYFQTKYYIKILIKQKIFKQIKGNN